MGFFHGTRERVQNSQQCTIFNVKKKITLNYSKSAAMGFFHGTRERVQNSHVKHAITVQATEGLLYMAPFYTAFHCHSFISLIWLKYVKRAVKMWNIHHLSNNTCHGKPALHKLFTIIYPGSYRLIQDKYIDRTQVQFTQVQINCF